MAKNKGKVIEPDIIDEAIEQEVPEVAEDTVEVAGVVIDEPIEEVEEKAVVNDIDQFLYTQLKMINKMNNPAKARRLAERVLRNKRGN